MRTAGLPDLRPCTETRLRAYRKARDAARVARGWRRILATLRFWWAHELAAEALISDPVGSRWVFVQAHKAGVELPAMRDWIDHAVLVFLPEAAR